MCFILWTGFDVEVHLAQTPLRDHKDLGMLSHTHRHLPLPEIHSSVTNVQSASVGTFPGASWVTLLGRALDRPISPSQHPSTHQ